MPPSAPRTDNAGVLVASGLIAGEALMGLGIATYVFFANKKDFPCVEIGSAAHWIVPFVLAALAIYMIVRPLQRAGGPDEPPPPTSLFEEPREKQYRQISRIFRQCAT